MSQREADRPASLLIGFFDPLDTVAVTEIARLAELGPVRVLVLGDTFPDRVCLSPARERYEIVRYVRGVGQVEIVRDPRQLVEMVDRAGPDALVSWLVHPSWPGIPTAPHSASHRVVVLRDTA
jgi:hypothetical protein